MIDIAEEGSECSEDEGSERSKIEVEAILVAMRGEKREKKKAGEASQVLQSWEISPFEDFDIQAMEAFCNEVSRALKMNAVEAAFAKLLDKCCTFHR